MTESIAIEEALHLKNAAFFDLRSPLEYRRGAIPGSYNVPLFDNDQRRQIGTAYRKQGAEKAKMLGLEIAAPRLPRLIKEIRRLADNRLPLLYCWRGGMRSLAVFNAFMALEYPARRLEGGYKTFRRLVHRRLEDDLPGEKQRVFVIHGLTGVGKTRLLKILAAGGRPVLDLEEAANHRGSVFGHIGLGAPINQKDFESRLFLRLNQLKSSPYLVVEGEGKRIGDLFLPPRLATAMKNGTHLLVQASLPNRIKRILEDYEASTITPALMEQVTQAVKSISHRLGRERTQGLLENLEQGALDKVVETLCVEYYDRLYGDSKPEKHSFSAVFNVDNLAKGAEEITRYLDSLVFNIWPN